MLSQCHQSRRNLRIFNIRVVARVDDIVVREAQAGQGHIQGGTALGDVLGHDHYKEDSVADSEVVEDVSFPCFQFFCLNLLNVLR